MLGRLFSKAGLIKAMGQGFVSVRGGRDVFFGAGQVGYRHRKLLHAGVGVESSKKLEVREPWVFGACPSGVGDSARARGFGHERADGCGGVVGFEPVDHAQKASVDRIAIAP